MAGKSLRNILTDKIRNRDAEVYRQTLDLSPGCNDYRMRDFRLKMSTKLLSNFN